MHSEVLMTYMPVLGTRHSLHPVTHRYDTLSQNRTSQPRRRVGLGRTDLILERTGCNWTILVCSGLYWTTLLELLDRAALN